MFNYEELDALASQAKKQLEEQNGGSIENRNLYSDIEYDYEGEDEDADEEIAYEDIYNQIDIKNSSEEYEEAPFLNLYDEPLFPGGPTRSKIEAWKKDWNGYDIYITEILNETFIFRTLNRFEYKQLVSLQNVDALQREEVICQTVTLWPDEYTWREMATTLAGIPSTYAEIIMEKSGFTKDFAIQVI